MMISLRPGMEKDRDEVIKQLIDIQYTRNEMDFHRGTFRVRGDVLEIFPANSTDRAVRVGNFSEMRSSVSQISMCLPERLKVWKTMQRFSLHLITLCLRSRSVVQQMPFWKR